MAQEPLSGFYGVALTWYGLGALSWLYLVALMRRAGAGRLVMTSACIVTPLMSLFAPANLVIFAFHAVMPFRVMLAINFVVRYLERPR